MKVSVRTLKAPSFEIEVDPHQQGVKKLIETTQGQNVYPAVQQMLIHQGNVLKNDITLEENKVLEKSFIVIMLSKTSVDRATPASLAAQPPVALAPVAPVSPPVQASTAVSSPAAVAASFLSCIFEKKKLVTGGNLDSTIQSIIEMGGAWDWDTVARALWAAYNNPERAVEYLYSAFIGGFLSRKRPLLVLKHLQQVVNQLILLSVEIPQSAQPAVPSSGPNSTPLNLFPHLCFKNWGNKIHKFCSTGGKQAEFLRLMNEPAEGAEESLLDQFAQTEAVTPEENEAIRLEQMGFERDLVLEVFFACNKDEQLAANYLLDHMNEFYDEAPR
ncbi:hypothetical protein ACP4OV_016794 [Aristida adscensionis]